MVQTNMRNITINITEKQIQREFSIIKQQKQNGYSTLYSWNNISLYFHWEEFYKKEIELWNENKLYRGLPLQSWIYLNRKKYIGKDATTLTDREILRAFKITGIHIGNSFHSPFYIKQFIEDYNINSIYDPTMGWGHRLLGAYNITYIGNDINSVTVDNNQKIIDYFNLQNKHLYNKDCSLFTPQQEYEAVFTCPPYFNVEKYTDLGAENLSYTGFLNWWEQTIIKSCMEKNTCKYFAFIINHTYKTDMANICEKYLCKCEEIQLGKQNYSHLNSVSRQQGEKGEFLLIFKKYNK